MKYTTFCIGIIWDWAACLKKYNAIYLLIKCIKSVLWRVVDRLSYIEDAWCIKVKKTRLCEIPKIWMYVIKTVCVASWRCEIGSSVLREENGVKVGRRIVWKRKRGKQKKQGKKTCLNSESVIWTVNSATTWSSLKGTGYNAVDELQNSVCLKRTSAYAFWLLRDFSEKCADKSLDCRSYLITRYCLMPCVTTTQLSSCERR